MNIFFGEDSEYIYDRNYNVEYELGNKRICTFNNTLKNVDDKYFWFFSQSEGVCIIRQDRIITMVCTD